MRYLLDTCVVSEGRKPSPDPRVISWFQRAHESSFFISVLTIGELEKGALRLPEGRKRVDLLKWIHDDLIPRFADRLLVVDTQITLKWGELQADAERHGRSLPAVDSLLAATALVHELTLVTRNHPDMEASGVPLFNPWGE